MKNLKCLIVIGFLLILNGALIYKLNLYKKTVSEINPILNKYKQSIVTFDEKFINERENENLVLNEETKFLDVEENLILAKDIFKSKKIVLIYSEFNCEECVESEINALLKNKNKLGKDVFLIAYYQNKRDFYIFYKEFQKKGLVDIEMYLLPDSGLNIPAEKLNRPFYFCIDSTLRITNFFIPHKEIPKLTESYLINTSKNFLSNNSDQ
ncbi:hypothetical protein [Algibacter pacificus]|uniref:hypothetical protein n=1 Tax=Algibacter pacificus TaxID=2599389 RepID=UPI0011CB2BD7|nr:hypothetical protein [Algibacter pacificus]